MKISVCYIVKNEEQNLEKSLKTVLPFADEILVADTGSNDGTKRVAGESGATVFDYTWQDDFSAARNFIRDKAKGDWIVFPDADEGFLHPEYIRDILKKIESNQDDIDAIMVRLIEQDMDEGGCVIATERALRVFRNKPNLRYRNRIHENIANLTGELKLYFADARMDMYHTGYSSSVIRSKVERNLRLLQQDIAENGEQEWHYSFLADCYFGLQDYNSALKYAVLSLDSNIDTIAARASVFHRAIESMRQLNWNLDEMLSLAEMAIHEFPKMPEFYGERGMILCGMGRLREAKQSLMKASELYENPQGDGIEGSYYSPRVASIIYARLGEISAIEAHNDEAEMYFLTAIKTDDTNQAAHEKYENFLRERNS